MKKNTTRVEKTRVVITIASLAICMTLVVGGVSSGKFMDFSRNMAMLSVGIMQPEGGARALSERLERIPAEQKGSEHKEKAAPYTPGGGNNTTGILSSQVPEKIPPEAGDGGKIKEEQLTSGRNFVKGVAIKNASSKTIDVAEQLKIKPDLGFTNTKDPQVLIMHTHTTEAYMTYCAGYYNANDVPRSQDEKRSVIAVGKSISTQLRAAGIGVIHNTTIHDYPKYTGAYSRSAETVKKILKQYPTICVVLDIHRDAISRSAKEKLKPTVVVNGRKAAQMMIITGVTDTDTMPHPHWQENLRLSLQLQSTLNMQYKGIVRPLYLVDSRYNQNLTKGSMLIEIGSEANTVNEAVYSGEILGKTLSQVLSSLKK